jgi:hypothetical protein
MASEWEGRWGGGWVPIGGVWVFFYPFLFFPAFAFAFAFALGG